MDTDSSVAAPGDAAATAASNPEAVAEAGATATAEAGATATADAPAASSAGPGTGVWQKRAFGELALPVGNRVQVIVGSGGNQKIHASSLIGYFEQRYLIVRQPMERNISLPLTVGEWIELRLFAGVHAIRFSCSVLRQLSPPLSQLLLSYPTSVETLRLRHTPRATVDLDATLSVPDGEPAGIPCKITDLSLQGARLVLPEPAAAVGTAGKLSFEFLPHADGAPVKLTVQAGIKSIKALGAAGQAAGVQFEGIPADSQTLLKAYIYANLLQSYWHAE